MASERGAVLQPFDAAKRAQLHSKGYLELSAGLPEWDIFNFVDSCYDKYVERALTILESTKDCWDDDDDDCRPGTLAAKRATKEFAEDGIYISAVHPSGSEHSDEYTGPRFYVSVIEAYMRRGDAPPPPKELADLLWSAPERERCPRVTELGWTMTPPCADDQVLHADICCWEPAERTDFGRFHHFLWKRALEKRCNTKIVSGGFTQGHAEDKDYDRCVQVSSRCLVIDSEVLHGGAGNPAGVWASTCTAQVSSTGGWRAMKRGGGASKTLLGYTVPVDTRPLGFCPPSVSSRSSASNPQDADGVPTERFLVGAKVSSLFEASWYKATILRCHRNGTYRVAWDGEDSITSGVLPDRIRKRRTPESDTDSDESSSPSKRPRVILRNGAGGVWEVGSKVEAEFEGEWFDAAVGKRRNDDGTYRVIWESDGSRTDSLPSGCIRARTAPVLGMEALSRELRSSGRARLLQGLPWQWGAFAFVERCHDLFGAFIVRKLVQLRCIWMNVNPSVRPGDFAAHLLSKCLEPFGVAVYAGPSSQSPEEPFRYTGPRFYVSLTKRAFFRLGEVPTMPANMVSFLWPDASDVKGQHRLRGLGWALCPPGSDPQSLHADIWGGEGHPRQGRVRFPHVIWKTGGQNATTEIAAGCFREGVPYEEDYHALKSVQCAAAVMDSEVSHRGAALAPLSPGQLPTTGWGASLSVEICSPAGWEAWLSKSTGGTTAPDDEDDDWRMLLVRGPEDADLGPDPDRACFLADLDDAERLSLESKAPVVSEATLKAEQRAYEWGH